MGRIAGVAAAETRERLMRAAADAFAERGYDGTRVADIAAAAGVSNSVLYAHFGAPLSPRMPPLRIGSSNSRQAAGGGMAAGYRG